ncbi:MAG: hypothetical protein IJ002_00740 [Clostridia bacterium]|nr:hypothetical protein [Clostridia bacterium]
MSTNVENAKTFDLALALKILKENHITDFITAAEIEKRQDICDIETLFTVLEEEGRPVSYEIRIDVKDIYGIIYEENVSVENYKTIVLRAPNSVRRMISKWNPPTETQMKIGDAVNDIYRRITEKIIGEYYYYTGRSNIKGEKGKYAYKLIVSDRNAIFVNLHSRIAHQVLIKR